MLMLIIAGVLPPLPRASQWRFAVLGIGATFLLLFPMQEHTNIFDFQLPRDVSIRGTTKQKVLCSNRDTCCLYSYRVGHVSPIQLTFYTVHARTHKYVIFFHSLCLLVIFEGLDELIALF
jgi:hypothetical protein